MAAMDFPNSPIIGQKYIPGPGMPTYTFDGEKWTTLEIKAEEGGIPVGPSTSIPLPDADVGDPGVENTWSRGDHVHPRDTESAGDDQPLMDGVAAAGSSSQYSREDHVHPSDLSRAPLDSPIFINNPTAPTPPSSDSSLALATTEFVTVAVAGGGAVAGAVVYNAAQTLLPTEAAQARKNIYAAPYDAMAYSGMQINGGVEVSQESGTAIITLPAGGNSIKHIADCWAVISNGPQQIDASQIASGNPPGYRCSIGIAPTTVNSAPSASHYAFIMARTEGYRMARLSWGTSNAQPMTIAFWAKAVRTGTYSGSINNIDTTRSYAFTFAISASNTWEYKTVTIQGDTIGTWSAGAGMGAQINFTMMAGTSLVTAPNTWTAGNFIGAPGTINGAAATSDAFYVTGLIVLPGIQVPTAAQSPNIKRPFDQELLTCKRYWQKSYNYWIAPGTLNELGGGQRQDIGSSTTGNLFTTGRFPVELHTIPAMTTYDANGTAGCVFKGVNGCAVTFQDIGTNGFTAGTTNSYNTGILFYHWKADARL